MANLSKSGLARLRAGALTLAALAGCNKADFNSVAAKVGTYEARASECDLDRPYKPDDLKLAVPPDTAKLVIQGDFCPRAPAELEIVFLVDFSLSMYREEDGSGNDVPTDGGKSCGRLAAVRALLSKLAAEGDATKQKVRFGAIQFGSSVLGELPLTDLAKMQDKLTFDNFCKGVDGTNYKAAFDELKSMIKDEHGTKLVYLLSDGLPTEGGGGERENAERHRKAALDAVAAVHAATPFNLTALFIKNTLDVKDKDFTPEGFLDQLTADPKSVRSPRAKSDRVKVVEKSADLAREILAVPPVQAELTREKTTVELQLSNGSMHIDLDTFEPHTSKKGVFTFMTVPFVPFENPGPNAKATTLKVSSVSDAGDNYSLNYQILPDASVSSDGSTGGATGSGTGGGASAP